MEVIRRLRVGDEGEWLRMRVALWPYEPEELLKKEMARIGREPEMTPVFVIDRGDGRLAGFLEGNLRSTAQGCYSTPVAYIEGWFVEAELRRRGWGGRLVEAFETWAREAGCTELASDCDLENATSLAAHRALGYMEETRLIHFRKELKGSGRGVRELPLK